MQLIDKETVIDTSIPRIVETPDYLIINTQVYDKSSLKPIPLNFQILTYGNVLTNLYRTIWTNWNHTGGAYIYMQFLHDIDKRKVMQDNVDSEIFYTITKKQTCAIYVNKYKRFKNENNEYTVQLINQTTWNEGVTPQGCSTSVYGADFIFLYQTDEYIIGFLCYPYNHGSWYTAGTKGYVLYKINKKTWAFHEYHNVGNTTSLYNMHFIKYYENTFYSFIEYGINFYINKYNLTTNTVTNLLTYTNTNSLDIVTNYTKIDNKYYYLTDYYQYYETDEERKHHYTFGRFTLDETTDTVTNDILKIDYNNINPDTDTNQTYNGIGQGVYHTLYSLTKNDNNYIICVIHSNPNYVYYPLQHKILVFKLEFDEDGNEYFILKTMTKFVNGCKGVMQYIENDANLLVTLHDDSYCFYKFDSTSESYIQTFRKSGVFYMLGFDELNRLYAQYDNNSIDIISISNSAVMKADFKEELYKIEGTENINTEVFYYVKNFADDFIEMDIKLSLYGQVTFEDGTKQKHLRTKPLINTIPVIITGGGKIEVVITQDS